MTNFLNMRCSQCGNEDSLDIQATLWIRVCQDGTDADASRDGTHDYAPTSPAQCAACGHSGTVEQFEKAGAISAPAPKRPWRVTVIEWHSHVATIETATRDEAFEEARRVLADNPDKLFRFSGSGIEAIEIEEAKP